MKSNFSFVLVVVLWNVGCFVIESSVIVPFDWKTFILKVFLMIIKETEDSDKDKYNIDWLDSWPILGVKGILLNIQKPCDYPNHPPYTNPYTSLYPSFFFFSKPT